MVQTQEQTVRTRTRVDPFADVYDSHIRPLLEQTEGRLYARTIMEHLIEKYPGKFSWTQLRTLSRRVKEWRHEHSPGPEAFIPQEHLPGIQAQVDFTNGTPLQVTILGHAYPHKLGQVILAYSKGRYVLPANGENLPAMLHLIQSALDHFGGAPTILRSDGLPSCVQNGKPINEYQEFLRHYGMRAGVIHPYRPHENGIVEQANFRLKNEIEQHLLLRGNRDFKSVEEYTAFVHTVVDRYNRRDAIAAALEVERSYLSPLPAVHAPIYEILSPVVDKCSLVRVKSNSYSVPSRCIGRKLRVRLYDDRLEIYHDDDLVASWGRIQGRGEMRVDYRHVIHWLALKPGAVENCVYRDQLFPTDVFRDGYSVMRRAVGSKADATYLRILCLAAMIDEGEVEAALALLLEEGEPFDVMDVWQTMASPGARMPPLPGHQLDMDFLEAA